MEIAQNFPSTDFELSCLLHCHGIIGFFPQLYQDTKHQSKKQKLLVVVEKIWHWSDMEKTSSKGVS